MHVGIVDWSEAQDYLRLIRHEVFVIEQHVPEADEWDSYDINATHFLAATPSGEPVGTARFLPSCKITRMAVRAPYRNHGVGSKILAEVLQHAAENGLMKVYLDAQIHAAKFYEKFGFCRQGGIFKDAGIDHVRMIKTQ